MPSEPGFRRLRMFCALMLEPELADRLAQPAARVLGLERGQAVRGLTAVRPEDLHLTLCFAGELLGGEVREMDSNLSLCFTEAPVPKLVLGPPDAFPSPGRERVLIARVREADGSKALAQLAERAEEAAQLSEVQLPREARSFEPHVTLARVRTDRHGSRPRVPRDFYGLDFEIEWQPRAVAWVESPGGGEPYRVLAEYPLGAPG